ncbi:hypothetical protein Pint_33738 [Pistacia integerrima]|uniref:Uncharacterized protein n=1 Tax=Pistacia integerrima TaxID=434235 RepID=A0ACC0X361_9ROSI|nr:hypothetical protein Pint_33738 [Pistacia integerrima]
MGLSNSFVGTKSTLLPKLLQSCHNKVLLIGGLLVFFCMRSSTAVHLSEVKIDRRHLPTFCTKTSLSQVAFRSILQVDNCLICC